MTIVLDSNVLLVAIGKRSRYRPIWEAFLNGSYKLVLSEDILFEYEEILLQHAASGAAEIVMEIFIESPDIVYQRVYYKWQAITNDVDDNKFFDVAIAANAKYLVTNDAHFNSAQKLGFPEVKIISAADFLEIIKSP